MPLPGGTSSKYADRYETLWTVLKLIELLDEKADSIILEPPGIEGEGVEFVLKRKDSKEYHQVKRQESQLGKWTVNALASKSVLSNFYKKTDHEGAICVFVSIQDAPELRELADRARRADDFQTFKGEFFTNENLKSAYLDLQTKLDLVNDEKELFLFLRRIEVETISERSLKKGVEALLEKLVDGNPRDIRNELSDFIKENLNRTSTAYELWRYLEGKGFQRLDLANNTSLIRQVNENNERYVQIIKQELVPGRFIKREETKQVQNWLKNKDQKGMLLTGDAGSGKSGIIYETIVMLKEEGIPHLVFRVDRLDPGDITPNLIAERLGIKYTPQVALDGIAAEKKSVLIIDQLDAVSLASGRLPKLFESVNEMIQHALNRSSGNMKVLMACRNFDVENDSRIKRLKKLELIRHIPVSKLKVEQIKETLSEVGINFKIFSNKKLNLLTLPINLKLFFEVYESNDSQFDFKTTEDLLQRYWDVKQISVQERSKSKIRWTEIIYRLVDYLSNHQVLSAPEEVLDQFDSEPKVLVSEHVLTLENGRFSFFHETFFDYAYSRKFLTNEQSHILEMLLSDEQHLFRRVQVRQLLRYLRKKDLKRYLQNLDELLGSDKLREHIRQIIFATLREIESPTSEEWRIVEKHLINSIANIVNSDIWRILNGSNQWILFIERDNYFSIWLENEESQLIDKVFYLLHDYKAENPDYVSDLLSQYLDKSEEWNRRILQLLSRDWETNKSRKLFDIFLKLILEEVEYIPQKGIEDNFFQLIFNLPKSNGEWASEALSKFLNKYIDRTLTENNQDDPNSYRTDLPQFHHHESVLKKLPEASPESFFRWLFPVIKRLIELNKIDEGTKPVRDNIFWTFNSFEDAYQFTGKLIACLDKSLELIEANSLDIYGNILNQLEDSDYYTINYLLLKAYRYGGKKIADRATSHLISNPSKLKIGDFRGSYWPVIDSLAAVTPHCTLDNFEQLENIILNFYPEINGLKKSIENGYRSFGYGQFVLLTGMDNSKLSKNGIKRLKEWKRKFNKSGPVKRQNPTVSAIPPPIDSKQAAKISDEQWLKAFKRYDGTRKDMLDGSLRGGARSLSHILETEVKKDPNRFLRFGLNLNYEINQAYFEAILRGVSESEEKLDSSSVTDFCLYCHEYPSRPFGRWITDLIKRLSEQEWPQELIKLIAWYAVEDPDPDKEKWKKTSENEKVYYDGSIYGFGINTVRGSVALTISQLMFRTSDKRKIDDLLPIIKQMVNDTSIAVRSTVAAILIGLLNHRRDVAVKLFVSLCDTNEELLGTRYIEKFLYYTARTHYSEVRSILEQMVESDFEEVSVAGARQVCLVALDVLEAQEIAGRCIVGSTNLRLGAAEIYAANLAQSRYRQFCEEQLAILFNDVNEQVRSKASECFRGIEEQDLGRFNDLIRRYADSRAFPERHDNLVYTIDESSVDIPQTIIYITNRFFDKVENDEIKRMGSNHSMLASDLSKLVLRAYSRAQDDSVKSECLDLIDKMFELNVYKISDDVQEFERR